MARVVPEEVWRTAFEHFGSLSHGLTLERTMLGRPTSRRNSVIVTWHNAVDEGGPYVRCRLCPEGFDRYFCDVYAPDPTERALPQIQAHFAQAHGITEIPASDIYSQNSRPREPKATWEPATPAAGARILCHLCPETGTRRIPLSPPPYGDARRLRELQRATPELYRLSADAIEARDRGLTAEEEHQAAKRALNRLRRAERAREPDRFEDALQDVLIAAVRSGKGITETIKLLAAASRRDPVKFVGIVGRSVPELAQQANRMEADAFAHEVARVLTGTERLPIIGERKLWDVWTDAKTKVSAAED